MPFSAQLKAGTVTKNLLAQNTSGKGGTSTTINQTIISNCSEFVVGRVALNKGDYVALDISGRLASPLAKVAIGILTEAGTIGATVKVQTSGIYTFDSNIFTSDKLGKPAYIANGTLVFKPFLNPSSITNLQRVGFVVSLNSIFIDFLEMENFT